MNDKKECTALVRYADVAFPKPVRVRKVARLRAIYSNGHEYIRAAGYRCSRCGQVKPKDWLARRFGPPCRGSRDEEGS